MDKKLASLITDYDFEQIELALREPNVFKALSIGRKEIRHSNFLAYILNPNENHGLNDIVLKKFLRDIFSDSKALNRTAFDSDYLDISTCEIRREWRNIDILIIFSKDIILIENKVDSLDHSSQLKRFKKVADENFPDKYRHFVYLTPFGSEPVDEASKEFYINYSYIQVADILERIISLYKNSISEKVKFYLEDYLSTIKRELLMNDSLNDLALKVYNAHKEALEFILENRPDPARMLFHYFEKELVDSGFVVIASNRLGFIRFTTPALKNIFERKDQSVLEKKEVFYFQIAYYETGPDAIIIAVIFGYDDVIWDKILFAVKDLTNLKRTYGKKCLVFYERKFNFNAKEIINEEQQDIEKKIKEIINETKPIALEISTAIMNVFIKVPPEINS